MDSHHNIKPDINQCNALIEQLAALMKQTNEQQKSFFGYPKSILDNDLTPEQIKVKNELNRRYSILLKLKFDLEDIKNNLERNNDFTDCHLHQPDLSSLTGFSKIKVESMDDVNKRIAEIFNTHILENDNQSEDEKENRKDKKRTCAIM